MKIHVAIALGAIGVSLLGCTHAFFRSPAQADIREAVPDDWISAAWLTRYRSEVEEKIASYIFERYPTIPDGIAGISVGKVTVTNKVKERNRTALESTERELQILFTDVADKVLGKRSRTIQVDIAATFMRPKTSDAETA